MKALFLIVFLVLWDFGSGDRGDFVNPDENKVVQNEAGDKLESDPDQLTIVKGETKRVTFTLSGNLTEPIRIFLNSTENVHLVPRFIEISPNNQSGSVDVTGLSVTSLTFIDVYDCETPENSNITCPFNKSATFVRVTVVHSNTISILVTITGWVYFLAWSISFYPQIWLNYKRSSVEGLNFDFLVLNILGFTCYTIYNWLMYFDHAVQDIYQTQHSRSLIPVLLNDVVFASHALLACLITGVQCFLYERGQQRVSYTCIGWASVLSAFSLVSFVITLFDILNWLQFINNLSYVKMAVTLSKYFPQAILNFRRKSTEGWSIGNVILDFTGGSMDICQMVLQASNTDDWSGFYGNPVKFGLGLVSMIFDVVFLIQHYCLYRETESGIDYNVVETSESTNISNRTNPSPSV
ncbi:hypothetical protein FO519_006839 [Halicephalobus sp. NKZ332]|nr:hypothetical protein FO519_006839 [Halicephalobus sp. NKZ332]